MTSRNHPRFRFSIRTMLLLVLVCGLLVGPVRVLRRAEKQKHAVEVLEAYGAQITYAHELDEYGQEITNPVDPSSGWLRKHLPKDVFRTPVRIRYGKHNSGDLVNFEKLLQLTTLEEIQLCYVVPQDLSKLSGFSELRKLELEIDRNNLFPKPSIDYSFLKKLPKLEWLDIEDEKVDPSVLGELQSLKYLRTIAKNLDFLKPECQIEELNLSFFMAENSWLKNIEGVENAKGLRVLRLQGTGVEDLSLIANLSSLQVLELPSNDFDFTQLEKLTKLRQLDVGYSGAGSTGSAVKGFEALKNNKELQQLQIRVYGESDLSGIAELPSLNSLYLECNSDTTTIPSLASLVRLKTLEVDSDDPTVYEKIKSLKQLEKLIINSETFTDVSQLVSLTGLKTLELDQTGVSDVAALVALPNLQHLKMPDGTSSSLPPLAKSKSLKSVSVGFSQNFDVQDIRLMAKEPSASSE